MVELFELKLCELTLFKQLPFDCHFTVDILISIRHFYKHLEIEQLQMER